MYASFQLPATPRPKSLQESTTVGPYAGQSVVSRSHVQGRWWFGHIFPWLHGLAAADP